METKIRNRSKEMENRRYFSKKGDIEGNGSYSIIREPGYSVGVYKIIFTNPHTSSDYVINSTSQKWVSLCTVWDAFPPTQNDFRIVLYSSSTNSLVDSIFHFNVMK